MENSEKFLTIENGVVTGCGREATEIVIPGGVTGIGNSAFLNCGFKSVTIPDSVTEIGKAAFLRCQSLETITIPQSMTDIGDRIFDGCSRLREITVDEKNPNYTSINGVLYSGDKKRLLCVLQGKNEVSFIIPDGVTKIGRGAFWGCSSLASVIIPDSVTEIGRQAFGSCESLETITFPDSVTRIKDEAFYDCKKLGSIIIPNGSALIGFDLFNECDSIGFIKFGEREFKTFKDREGNITDKAVDQFEEFFFINDDAERDEGDAEDFDEDDE